MPFLHLLFCKCLQLKIILVPKGPVLEWFILPPSTYTHVFTSVFISLLYVYIRISHRRANMYDSIHTGPQSSQIPRDKKLNGVTRGWDRRMESQCLVGTEIELKKAKMFWRWVVRWLHNNVAVLSPTELQYIQKVVKVVNIMLLIF